MKLIEVLIPLEFFIFYSGKGCLEHDTYYLAIAIIHLIILLKIWEKNYGQ